MIKYAQFGSQLLFSECVVFLFVLRFGIRKKGGDNRRQQKCSSAFRLITHNAFEGKKVSVNVFSREEKKTYFNGANILNTWTMCFVSNEKK